MAASNTSSYHIAGPIVPACNLTSGGTYVGLGVCEDGADIQIQVATNPIKPDGGGGPNSFEVNEYFLGMVVTVKFTLIPFAGSYINVLRAMAQAGSYNLSANPVTATDGVMPTPGKMYGVGTALSPGSFWYPGLYLPVSGSEGDGPWWFPHCRVVLPGNNKVGVKPTAPQFEFRALNYMNAALVGTISGQTLYTRTAPV